MTRRNAHVQAYGIVDVYPHFARYSDAKPGRHNESVWPMIQGYWADAAIRAGEPARFAAEVLTLASLANASGGFYEIYNFASGSGAVTAAPPNNGPSRPAAPSECWARAWT